MHRTPSEPGRRERSRLEASGEGAWQLWKEALSVAQSIHDGGGSCRDGILRERLLAMASSVPGNILEGAERQDAKKMIQFLHIARGGCAEVITLLLIAEQTDNLDRTVGRRLLGSTRSLWEGLGALASSLRETSPSGGC